VFPDAGGRVVHIVSGWSHTVYTIEVATMEQVAPPIQLPRDHDLQPGFEFGGALTRDGRYIVTRRLEMEPTNSVNVVDLEERRSWTLPLQGVACQTPWELRCGEVAFNHGPKNTGLLAVRGSQDVSVYEFRPHGPLKKLSRWPLGILPEWRFAPVAWSGDGSRLIVGTLNENRADFLVLEVAEGGRSISPVRWLHGCESQDGQNLPYAIFTANRGLERVPTMSPTPPSPTATTPPSPTPPTTSTASPSATGTATSSPTPTETPAPTPVPKSVHLPLLLRESCDPEHQRADVVLVVDTSSSMTGRKLEDAKASALLFVGMIDLAPGRSQVAVVRYDREADVVRELTQEQAVIEEAIRGLLVRSGTHIDKGLVAALGELQSPRHVDRNMPVVVLLTDGLHTGVPGEELRAAQEVRDAGIRLYAIGLGVDVDEDTLMTMAGDNSRYYHAPDSDDLARIYAEIAQDLMCPGKDLWGGK
jgi:Mg-chelatase subunit ChlD